MESEGSDAFRGKEGTLLKVISLRIEHRFSLFLFLSYFDPVFARSLILFVIFSSFSSSTSYIPIFSDDDRNGSISSISTSTVF